MCDRAGRARNPLYCSGETDASRIIRDDKGNALASGPLCTMFVESISVNETSLRKQDSPMQSVHCCTCLDEVQEHMRDIWVYRMNNGLVDNICRRRALATRLIRTGYDVDGLEP